jgi:hypothetical protein
MPRIDDNFLDSVFYVYPSEYAAMEGEQVGGCGFFATVESKQIPAITHLYAVTNAHVVRNADNLVLRINTKSGKGVETINTESRRWVCHSDGDDVAVLHLGGVIKDDLKVFGIGTTVFANEEILQKLKLGPGDEVFMVGRFVNHEGKQRNLPSVRFGNIAMMPLEPIIMPKTGIRQEAFLVEARSLPGYSGSPVFWYIPDFSRRPGSNKLEARNYRGLLGIDAGHVETKIPVIDDSDNAHPDKWQVSLNSGMAILVPAWKILELVNSEDVEDYRHAWEKGIIEDVKQIQTEYETIRKAIESGQVSDELKEQIQERMDKIGVSLRKYLE